MRTGHFIESYGRHVALTDNRSVWAWTALLLLALLALPLFAGNYAMSLAVTVCIAAIGAIGLNLLTGVTGLISLGHAGFLAVGCYTTALLIADYGWPPEPALLASGFAAAAASLFIGIPSLRLKGLYLAITTLAFSFIITHFLLYSGELTGGPYGVRVTSRHVFGLDIASQRQLFYLALAVLCLVVIAALNLMRTRIGRAWTAIRDHDVAARAMGISLVRYKLFAFAVSSFIVGIAGGLMAFQFRFINVDLFNLLISIEALAMVIVGGLGSVAGAILGAVFIVLLPEAVRALTDLMPAWAAGASSTYVYEIRGLLTGLAMIVMLRIEPHGLIGIWRKVKRYWTHWPLAM